MGFTNGKSANRRFCQIKNKFRSMAGCASDDQEEAPPSEAKNASSSRKRRAMSDTGSVDDAFREILDELDSALAGVSEEAVASQAKKASSKPARKRRAMNDAGSVDDAAGKFLEELDSLASTLDNMMTQRALWLRQMRDQDMNMLW